MSGISYEFLAGSLASISIFTIWLFAFHKKFIISIVNTRKVNTLGIYTDFGEALRTHFWYLLKAKVLPGYRKPDREALEERVKAEFLELVTKGEEESNHGGRALVSQGGDSIEKKMA